jgi:hypothetical protein
MNREEIKIGARVHDRASHRKGVVLSIHKPANVNLDPTEALVQTDVNAISWTSFENLEVA